MNKEKLLLVAPAALQKQFLKNAHDNTGHQGTDRTMARLSEAVYWVGVVTSRPWELVAVDILKVPMSHQGNQYMLVAQDYFSKWPFAAPLRDQTADKIVQALKDQVFTLVGPPR